MYPSELTASVWFPGGKVSTKWPLMFVCTIVLPNVTVTDDSAFPSSSTTLPVTVRSSLSVDKIWDLARMDRRMPKKSTYFWPKMWSGLVYYRMR